MSDDDKAIYRSKTGPLGSEKFENDPEDISPEDLLKSYSADFLKEMDAFTEKVRAMVREAQEKKGRRRDH